MLDDLPILGVCGWSGSGKTVLLEALVPRLAAKGLNVAVVKHDVHGIRVDRPGKDSDRLFRSGADVLVRGPGERLLRSHEAGGEGLRRVLWELAQRYDIVLLEGHKDAPVAKVWLQGGDRAGPPPQCEGIVATLPPESDRVGAVMSLLDDWLPSQWLKTPVGRCVLCGDRSGRVGAPGAPPRDDGGRRLAQIVALLERVTERVIAVGARKVPQTLRERLSLLDVVDADGPVAEIIAAMRWAPQVSLLVATCDLPHLTLDALDWLLSTRAPGIWATLPRSPGSSHVAPAIAHYDFRSRPLLEDLAAQGDLRPGGLASSSKVISPSAPLCLGQAWRTAGATTA